MYDFHVHTTFSPDGQSTAVEYCRRAADILHDSLKANWSAVAGGASKSDEAALYAEYAIDFAALAMRYALLATATALDMQYEEERNKDE